MRRGGRLRSVDVSEAINDVYRIHIPGNRWTHLQLLLPVSEWVRVRLHEQLPVATDANGLLVYESFISPKDPALGGEDADDPIERRTLLSGGWPAREDVPHAVDFRRRSRCDC